MGDDMGIPEIGLALSAAGLGYGIYSGERAQSQSADAASEAKKRARKAELDAQQATNKANQKTPDINSILQRSRDKPSSTMLTGSYGVDPSRLNLGKSTLLGG